MNNLEEFQVKGQELLGKIQELIQEGNVRHLVIKQKNRIFLEIPLTILTVTAILAPYFVLIGFLGTIISDCTVEVARKK